MVFIADAEKRNISKLLIQEERPKIVMVSSSDKDILQQGHAVESGLGLYTPPGPVGSGIGPAFLALARTYALWYSY